MWVEGTSGTWFVAGVRVAWGGAWSGVAGARMSEMELSVGKETMSDSMRRGWPEIVMTRCDAQVDPMATMGVEQ